MEQSQKDKTFNKSSIISKFSAVSSINFITSVLLLFSFFVICHTVPTKWGVLNCDGHCHYLQNLDLVNLNVLLSATQQNDLSCQAVIDKVGRESFFRPKRKAVVHLFIFIVLCADVSLAAIRSLVEPVELCI